MSIADLVRIGISSVWMDGGERGVCTQVFFQYLKRRSYSLCDSHSITRVTTCVPSPATEYINRQFLKKLYFHRLSIPYFVMYNLGINRLGTKNPAKGIHGDHIKCCIQLIKNLFFFCSSRLEHKKSLLYLLICKIYGRFHRTFR